MASEPPFQHPHTLGIIITPPIPPAEKLYGDWKSMDIVLSDVDKRPNPVGR